MSKMHDELIQNNFKLLQFNYTISLNKYKGFTRTGIQYLKKEAIEYISHVDSVLQKNNVILNENLCEIVIIQHPKKIKTIPKFEDKELYFLKQKRQDLDNINKVLLDALQLKKNDINNINKLYKNDNQIIKISIYLGKEIENGGIDLYYKFLDSNDINHYVKNLT